MQLIPFGIAEFAELERRMLSLHLRRVRAATTHDPALRRQLIAQVMDDAANGQWCAGAPKFLAMVRSAEAAPILLWLALRPSQRALHVAQPAALLRGAKSPRIVATLWRMAGVDMSDAAHSADGAYPAGGINPADRTAARRAEIFDAICVAAECSPAELAAKDSDALASLIRPYVRGEIDRARLGQWAAQYAKDKLS